MRVSGFAIWVLTLTLLLGVSGAASASEVLELPVDDAVRQALDSNLGLQLQRQDVESARGQLESAHGPFDTVVSAGADTGETRVKNTSVFSSRKTIQEETADWNAAVSKTFQTGTNVSVNWDNQRSKTNSPLTSLDPAYSSALQLNVEQPLLQGRGTERQTLGIRAAEHGVEGAEFQVDDQAAQLAANVKKAYWQLSLARQDIEVRKLSLELAGKLLDETQAKIDAGVLAPVDVYQPQAEVARREELLIRSQKTASDAEDALKALLNLEDWSGEIRLVDTPRPGAPEPLMEAVVARALEIRKDIKAAEAQLAANRMLRERAEDAVLPSLSLVGGAGLSGLDKEYGGALSDFTNESYTRWNIGFRFSVPIENRGAHGEAVRTRSEEQKASLQLELLKQDVTVQARSAVRSVQTAGKALLASQKSALAFKKRLEAEQSRFEVGLSTANDVLQAQEEYAQALIGEKTALVGLENALADLDRVQGQVTLARIEPEQTP